MYIYNILCQANSDIKKKDELLHKYVNIINSYKSERQHNLQYSRPISINTNSNNNKEIMNNKIDIDSDINNNIQRKSLSTSLQVDNINDSTISTYYHNTTNNSNNKTTLTSANTTTSSSSTSIAANNNNTTTTNLSINSGNSSNSAGIATIVSTRKQSTATLPRNKHHSTSTLEFLRKGPNYSIRK